MKDFEPKTDNIGKIKIGTQFTGDINNCRCEVVDIQNDRNDDSPNSQKNTALKRCKTC